MAHKNVEFYVRGEWVSSEMPICEKHFGKDNLNRKDQGNTVDVEEKLSIFSDDLSGVNIN
jgi:hypothetical protein